MHEESPRYSKLQYSEKKMRRFLDTLIRDQLGIVILSDHGMFVGVANRPYFGDDLCSQDMLLYVLPQYRGSMEATRLLKAYVAAAKSLGVKDIGIGNSTLVNTDRVEKFYERMGFRRTGANFVLEN
jgi:GNAT superfamily N-acetyltransferase